MKNTHDAVRLENQAPDHEAIAEKLRLKAQQARGQQGAGDSKLERVSPHTKLSVEHPESQAVEREKYLMGQSYCAHPIPPSELDAFLRSDREKHE